MLRDGGRQICVPDLTDVHAANNHQQTITTYVCDVVQKCVSGGPQWYCSGCTRSNMHTATVRAVELGVFCMHGTDIECRYQRPV